MDIYLDANATTPVLAPARAAALHAMQEHYGNPSSIHGTGLRARAIVDRTRELARATLGATTGRMLFVSGATEGIQTAVLSALRAIRERHATASRPPCLLHGATEHKAVPEALRHWNALLGLDLEVLAIPVDRDGRHDLDWLRRQAPHAALVCTMAANNETGVVSDLDGIEAALQGSPALWLVDGVQALGKMALDLASRRIDYACFSGHKLYAPKGIGLLYVREGAPFTPLMAGGGQEGGLRSGTENMAGIAGLGAVLAALDDGHSFRSAATLAGYRDRLATALQDAFPGLVFNAPPALCLPTTLNFSVPGLEARLLLDVFDAAGVRVSGGSACGAARALPSEVLAAMGLPTWRCASAVRLSFGPAEEEAVVEQACERIRACGAALRASGLNGPQPRQALPADGLLRLHEDGANCWLLADAGSGRCVVVDPTTGLADRIAQWVAARGLQVAAVLCTTPETPAARLLRQTLGVPGPVEAGGWPRGAESLALGRRTLLRLALDATRAYALRQDDRPRAIFIGTASPARLGGAVDPDTLLLPARDDADRFATTLRAERSASAGAPATPGVELDAAGLAALLGRFAGAMVVDVRESYEQRLGARPALDDRVQFQAASLSTLADAFPEWLGQAPMRPVVFFCRSGQRSARAARALRRLGHPQAWSLVGGLAQWPAEPALRNG